MAALLGVGIVTFCLAAALLTRPFFRPGRLAIDPGRPRVAAGGRWRIGADDLVLEPDRTARIVVTFVPDGTFEARAVRAALVATETWWVWRSSNHDGDRETGRICHSEVIREIAPDAVDLPGGAPPIAFRQGEPAELAFEFRLDGLVPSTAGDPDVLACSWELLVEIDRPLHVDPRLAQPVVVTQPRDRLNSGIVPQAQFSRYETVLADGNGALHAEIEVRPAPLDLVAPASIEIRLAARTATRAREIRAEIVADQKVTVAEGDEVTRTLWAGSIAVPGLRAGESAFQLRLQPLGLPFPDSDLPHGTIRGRPCVTVDRPALPDLHAERDLCLCLDKPRRAARAPAVAATR